MTQIKELTKKKTTELVEIAKELGIDSSGKKNELIQKGLKNIKNFEWEDTAKKTLEVYYKVLGDNT